MHWHGNVILHAGNAWVAAGNSLAFRDGPYAAGCNPPAVCPLPPTLTEMPVALGAIAVYINIPGTIRQCAPALISWWAMLDVEQIGNERCDQDMPIL